MRERLALSLLPLWAVFALRSHAILRLPAFVDESLHILRAQVVFQFTDAVASFLPGKLLTYYYLGLFDPQNESALWLSRQALALLTPLAAALCYGLLRALNGQARSSLIIFPLYAFAPFTLFFERMALTDAVAGLFAVAAAWAGVRLGRKPTLGRASVLGLALGGALLAKLTALPLLILPLWALWLWRGGPVWAHRQILLACYGMALACISLPLLYTVYQTLAPDGSRPAVVTPDLYTTAERNRLEQTFYNVKVYGEALASPFASALLLLLGAFLAASRPRPALYLLGLFGAGLGFLLLTSAIPSPRYLGLIYPLGLCLFAYGLVERFGASRRRGILAAGVLAWCGVGFSTALSLWDDPTTVITHPRNRYEYVQHTSSGYALREAAANLRGRGAHLVQGYVGSCHLLRFYLPATTRLACPNFPFHDNPALLPAEEKVAPKGEYYLLLERTAEQANALIPSGARLLAVYPRPLDGVAVELYWVRDGDG